MYFFLLQHGIPEPPMDYTWKQRCSYIRASIMLPKLVSQIAYIHLCMDDSLNASLCLPKVHKYICASVHSLFQPNSWTGQWFLLILSWAGPQGALQSDRQPAMAFSAAGSGEQAWRVSRVLYNMMLPGRCVLVQLQFLFKSQLHEIRSVCVILLIWSCQLKENWSFDQFPDFIKECM